MNKKRKTQILGDRTPDRGRELAKNISKLQDREEHKGIKRTDT
jgi:hypothetical protein